MSFTPGLVCSGIHIIHIWVHVWYLGYLRVSVAYTSGLMSVISLKGNAARCCAAHGLDNCYAVALGKSTAYTEALC